MTSSLAPISSLRRLNLRKVRQWVMPGLRHLHHSRLRTCRCCRRLSVILALDNTGEIQRCLRCGANLRYELLADLLHSESDRLRSLEVLELDPNSPLRPLLGQSRVHHRSFYAPDAEPGSLRPDGARCEDVTRLTFGDSSLDLVISSEVLEHVPEVRRAGEEIARVLRPGGRHLFTVPTSDAQPTLQRARIVDGQVEHLLQPEYHGDPLGKEGILA